MGAQTFTTLTEEQLVELMRKAVAEALQKAPPPATKRYMDAGEISKYYGVSRTTVNQWTKQDGCPHMMKGKVLRFEAWFRGREAGLRRVK